MRAPFTSHPRPAGCMSEDITGDSCGMCTLTRCRHAEPVPSEQKQALHDAAMLGTGFLVDGKRVSPERVQMVFAPGTQKPEDTLILDWLERQHTLHREVEACYVVDGYEVYITHDGAPIPGREWHGATLREAYSKAMQDWDVTHGDVVLKDTGPIRPEPLDYLELTYLIQCVERDPRMLDSVKAVHAKLLRMREPFRR